MLPFSETRWEGREGGKWVKTTPASIGYQPIPIQSVVNLIQITVSLRHHTIPLANQKKRAQNE